MNKSAKEQRYITNGIKQEIPELIPLILWSLIELAGQQTELDYLQVFELEPVKMEGNCVVQKIIHRQEQPAYQHTVHLTLPEVAKAKIFVIAGTGDDGLTPIETMMLAEEY